jgi:hypothetical protein
LAGTLSCLAACRDQVEVVVRSTSDAAATGGAATGGTGGRDAGAGSGGASGGATSDAGAGGATCGGGATGGQGSPVAGAGGAGASGGTADAGNVPEAGTSADAGGCVLDRDCPRPPTPCAVARCDHGLCTAASAKAGTVIPDVPGDCHDVVCDGTGGVASRQLDENNVPVFENGCIAGTCNKVGVAGVENLVAGAPCHLSGGPKVCDGSGRCVDCLVQGDCAAGLYCQWDHSCGTKPCTDVACGGGCMPCDLGGRCLANADCLSYVCDTAALACITDHCLDHHLDADESDVDCGGYNRCARCALGAICREPHDCASGFCNVLTHQCVPAADGCTDHALDGDETDIDCGGTVCPPCGSTRYCKVATDCQPGLHCSGNPLACY